MEHFMKILSKITRLRIFIVVAFIISIISFADGITENINRNKPREDLYALEDFTFSNGQYITAEVDFVWDNYGEVTTVHTNYGIKTGETPFSQVYLIDCYDKNGEHRFISAEVTHENDIAAFDEIENNSWFAGEDAIFSKSFSFVGRVTKIDAELIDFAYENMLAYEWITTRAEFDELFLPYSVRVLNGSAYDPNMSFGIGVVLLLGGWVMMIIDILKTRKEKDRDRAYAEVIAQREIEAAAKAEIEASQPVFDEQSDSATTEMPSISAPPDSGEPDTPPAEVITEPALQENPQDGKTDDFTFV
jgi:hypothetical protein